MNMNLKGGANNIKGPEKPINSQGPPKPTTGPPINKNPATNNKKSSNNNKPEVKLLTIFNLIPVFLHTFVKIMPVGLYLASFLESMLFNDIRGFLIFIGLLINDLINIGYNYMMKPKPNMNCAIIRNVYTDDFFSFATPHTQYISFITAFLMASMYFKNVFYYSTFFMFVIIKCGSPIANTFIFPNIYF